MLKKVSVWINTRNKTSQETWQKFLLFSSCYKVVFRIPKDRVELLDDKRHQSPQT